MIIVHSYPKVVTDFPSTFQIEKSADGRHSNVSDDFRKPYEHFRDKIIFAKNAKILQIGRINRFV